VADSKLAKGWGAEFGRLSFQEEYPLTRSLVTTNRVRPPKELEALFEEVPLLGRERREEYDAFFSAISMAQPPSDAIDWLLVKDLVDLSWEIRRERRIKVEIVKLNQTEVVCDLLKSTFNKADRLRSDLNRIFGARTEAQFGRAMRRRERVLTPG
jgi:hypothetical protein